MDASIRSTCTQVRRDIINMTADAGCGHPGGSLSIVEALVALYFDVMNIDPQNPKAENRDRFVLSKGHAAPALYAVLGERGFFDTAEFKQFRQLDSILQGHPDMKRCPGVDASTGSLGQGCSIAVGMALGAKLQKKDCRRLWSARPAEPSRTVSSSPSPSPRVQHFITRQTAPHHRSANRHRVPTDASLSARAPSSVSCLPAKVA